MKKRVIYYSSFDEDFASSKNQEFRLDEDYDWIGGWGRKIGSIILWPIAVVVSWFYMRFVARIRIVNRRALKQARGGFFLYANHVLEFGDVVNAFCLTWPRRPHLICSSANLGIAMIGSWLPAFGALPLPDSVSGMKKLSLAIGKRIEQGRAIVIYPEGHMWPYHTEIRPFANGSFHYPIAFDAPAYCATTTFQKSILFRRPRTTIYIDGPFAADDNLSRKEQQKVLEKQVCDAMLERVGQNNYKYVTYRKKV